MMRTERKAAATPLAVLLGFEVAAIVGLHALGSSHAMQVPWGDFSTWFSTGSIDEVAAPLIRVSALAIAYWMFVSTALTVVAQVSRIPAAVRATSMFTLPSVRRVVDSAMVVSIATTSVVGMGATAAGAQVDGDLSVSTPRPTTSAAQVDITTSTEAETTTTTAAETTTTTAAETITTLAQIPGDSGSGSVSTPRPTTAAGGETTTSTTQAPTTSTTAAPQTTTTVPAPEAAPEAAEVLGASEHRVVAGDNLWTIARDALVQAGNADPSEAEVRDYWLQVIEANRDNLRSNDPHWIFPGEIINLPAMGAPAGS